MPDPEKKPILLLVLDGLGLAPEGPGNAISLARTPNLDMIDGKYPRASLTCSGPDVGLPRQQMGNSEVGHMNIGAGRVVYQDIMRINQAIENSDLSRNPELNRVLSQTREGGRLHLMGLVSDGGVHSLQKHLHSLVDLAKEKGVKELFVHCFLDGRDTSPTSGADFTARLQEHLKRTGIGRIATVAGRYYAMDRDKRWERTRLAYDALTLGRGIKADDPVELIKNRYDQGETDEFIKPHVLVDSDDHPVATLEDGDKVIFFNFRADRARQMTRALSQPDFNGFERRKTPDLRLATMTRYEKEFDLPVLFPPEKMDNILGQIISRNNLTQLRLAETEKYAHVTYFFNAGSEEPFPGEERILIPSPQEVPTYDLKPEMSVYQVTDTLVEKINTQGFDLYICNFANLDMVGHTGSIPAAIEACQAVDKCVGRVLQTALKQGITILLTADHGNAEDMLDQNGKVKTSHSLNPVPFYLIHPDREIKLKQNGILGDIAPTILDLWDMEKPAEMTGQSLLDRS
ncbi:MAG: 2,3-bisphosphoglycerate-independent phosphoglycerate mutase [Desulfonatronovibrio sp.]